MSMIPFNIRHLGLRTKLALIVSVIIGLISIFIFVYFPQRHREQEMEGTAARAKSIAVMTAFNVGAAILFDDTTTIHEAFGAARENKDLMYIIVQDKQGVILASYSGDKVSLGHSHVSVAEDFISEEEEFYQSSVPVLHRGEELGKVIIGISLQQLNEEVRSVRMAIGALSALIFLAGIVIAYWTSTWITTPLRLIAHTAQQISAGDISKRAPEISQDEVGKMARAFNVMVDNLETVNRELESRVRERTSQLQFQSERLAVFSQTGQALNSAATPLDAARIIADVADRLFGWDACTIDYYSHGSIFPVLNIDTINDVRTDVPATLVNRPPTERMQRIIEKGAEIICRAPGEGFPRNVVPFGDTQRPSMSLMFAPIKSGEKVTGILSIQSYRQDAYKDDDLKTLQSLADYCGGALERIQNTDALRTSEKKYRDIVEFAPVGIYQFGKDGTIVSANSEMSRILGYSSVEELIRCGMEQLYFDVNDSERLIDILERNGSAQNVEIRWKKKDGSPVWIELASHAIEDEQEKALCFEGFVKDISPRKKADEALKESLAFQRAIFEGSRDAVFIAADNSAFVSVNEAACQLTGYSKEELLSMRIPDLHDEADLDAYDQFHDRIMGGEQILSEASIRRKDGTKVETEFNNTRIFIGGVPFMHTTARDSTERQKAQSHIVFQARLLDAVEEAVIATDHDGRIVFWNSFARKLYGWEEADVLGKNLIEAIPSPDGRSRAGEIAKRLLSGGSWSGEMVVHRRDGTSFPAQVADSPILEEGGGLIGMVSVSVDISERKALETQFLRAQRLESLGTLAGGIAHDLNNVLGPIMLTFDILRQDIGEGKYKKLLENAESSTLRGKNIVSQILMFARGNQGERGPIQSKHIIKEVLGIIGETFPRNIEIKSDILKDLPPLNADATQIHQVIMNLCVNARDAMPNGGVLTLKAQNFEVDEQFEKLHISAKRGRYVLLSISDTGTGIPSEIIDRIFDPFFTTKGAGKGTGLGLSTVHAVVKNHGGFVDVKSEPEHGSTFRVFLPALEGDEPPFQRKEVEIEWNGKGHTILVVDDEETVREVTKQSLETFGYEVLTAEDGVAAVVNFSLNRERISAVVTDVMMPLMDGIALTRALRRMEPNLKIIAVSGMLPESYVHILENMGVDAILSKPFTSRDLMKALGDALLI